jgi:hypothetical protein
MAQAAEAEGEAASGRRGLESRMDIKLSVGGFGGSCIATQRGDEAPFLRRVLHLARCMCTRAADGG